MSRPDQGAPNSAAAEQQMQVLGSSVWVCEHTDVVAASKSRCTLNEIIKETQHILERGELEVLLFECGVVRQWQLSELVWSGWRKLMLFQHCCQKKTQKCHFSPWFL